jgi:hypothetical protein
MIDVGPAGETLRLQILEEALARRQAALSAVQELREAANEQRHEIERMVHLLVGTPPEYSSGPEREDR